MTLFFVDDVVKFNMWPWDNSQTSDIFSCDTGRCQTTNDIANAVINYHQKVQIGYIPFHDALKCAYQSYTQTDISKLRDAGYSKPLKTLEQVIPEYMAWFENQHFIGQ